MNPVLPTVVCAIPYCCRLFAINKLKPHSAPPIKVDLFHPVRIVPLFLSTSILTSIIAPIVTTARANRKALNVNTGTSEDALLCAKNAKPQMSAHNDTKKIPIKL